MNDSLLSSSAFGLIGADATNSPYLVLAAATAKRINYTPFGRSSAQRVGYNGQMKEAITNGYFLGNGHRHYSPTLYRFIAWDSLSPFVAGGINGYAYTGGEPVNRIDPSGRSWLNRALSRIREWTMPARRQPRHPAVVLQRVRHHMDLTPVSEVRAAVLEKTPAWTTRDLIIVPPDAYSSSRIPPLSRSESLRSGRSSASSVERLPVTRPTRRGALDANDLEELRQFRLGRGINDDMSNARRFSTSSIRSTGSIDSLVARSMDPPPPYPLPPSYEEAVESAARR
ncbi:RHS repeat-associated core domain-containing protein [Pseudomonas sp. DC3000-4b1]|uniref:RHS repeat-associated core domain-containing protein n=1 Tax=unclassified Pseudomonas TaxID=196821 RepID=UPI003CF04297